jgi:hypothetical protein
MTSNTRAVAALRQIMLDDSETMPIRRRIEAAEQLLEYEAPVEIVEDAKAFLTSIAEAEETLVDFRLDALKLLRKAEARKVVPPKASVRNNPRRIEMCRALEIAKRRAALWEPACFRSRRATTMISPARIMCQCRLMMMRSRCRTWPTHCATRASRTCERLAPKVLEAR